MILDVLSVQVMAQACMVFETLVSYGKDSVILYCFALQDFFIPNKFGMPLAGMSEVLSHYSYVSGFLFHVAFYV